MRERTRIANVVPLDRLNNRLRASLIVLAVGVFVSLSLSLSLSLVSRAGLP